MNKDNDDLIPNFHFGIFEEDRGRLFFLVFVMVAIVVAKLL